MAKSESYVCDLSGSSIPEGEEISLYVDYKGKRSVFHLSPEVVKLGEHDLSGLVLAALPKEREVASAQENSKQG